MTSSKLFLPEFFSNFAYCFNRFFLSHSYKWIAFFRYAFAKLLPQSFSLFYVFIFHYLSPHNKFYYEINSLPTESLTIRRSSLSIETTYKNFIRHQIEKTRREMWQKNIRLFFEQWNLCEVNRNYGGLTSIVINNQKFSGLIVKSGGNLWTNVFSAAEKW